MNNGGFGAGAVNNTQQSITGNLTISGSLQTVPGNTLPATNSLATVAIDMTACSNCGNGAEFQYSAELAGGAPNLGDEYGFTVTYSHGTVENGTVVNGAVTPFGSTGAVAGPSDLPTLTSLNVTASSDTPTFTWTDPNFTNPGNYYYSFYLSENSCGCNIWEIPGNNSDSNGFSNSIDSITWGTDPTNPSPATPSVSSLTHGACYWGLTVQNSSNNSQANSAGISVNFVTP